MEDDLLVKYIQKNCSKEEEKKVRHWLTQTKDHRRLFELEEIYALKNEFYYQKQDKSKAAYQCLMEKIQPIFLLNQTHSVRPNFWRNFLAFAASITFLCLLSLNTYYWIQHDQYTDNTIQNTLTTPKGQHASIQLSDGTRVWLNADSKLSYPSHFEKNQRQVTLNGEAYFEVTNQPERPFYVQLPSLKIKVLGTKFNAKAYANESHCITLNEGKVEVSLADGSRTEQMEPKDQIHYTPKGVFKHLKNVNIPLTANWIQGDLCIDDLPLSAFIPDLERHFDIHVHIQDKTISTIHFTCHFKNGINLQEALDLLKATRKMDYIMDGKDIYFYKYPILKQ